MGHSPLILVGVLRTLPFSPSWPLPFDLLEYAPEDLDELLPGVHVILVDDELEVIDDTNDLVPRFLDVLDIFDVLDDVGALHHVLIRFEEEAIFVLLGREGSSTWRPRYEFELTGETLKAIVTPTGEHRLETMDIRKHGIAIAVRREMITSVEVYRRPRPQPDNVRTGALASVGQPRLQESLSVATSAYSEELLEDYIEVVERLRAQGFPNSRLGSRLEIRRK